ncbi:uncharacterized protein LOC142234755 [Haematobia irritans]|uniref:uncharacterized protein LOC142234755 n=1 Tax=Haematobia irritans TaxID=7368 RepID=UPI003F4FBC03
MITLRGLKLALIVTLAIGSSSATPLKRSNGRKSARQIEFTTPSTLVETKTGYPEAGFRPRIPFDLPKPKAVTESAIDTTTEAFETLSTTTSSTLEDFDEIVPTTTQKPEIEDYTPADTYGAPDFSPKLSEEEFEAEVVPAPAVDFQPPSEEESQDFSAPFVIVDDADSEFIADIPAAEQTPETSESEAEVLETTVNEIPETIYGAPANEPKTDVESIEQEEVVVKAIDIDSQVEETQEGSAETTLELVGEGETTIQEPAEIYGAPESEADNELQSELAEVEQQIEILSRLTKLKNGRLVLLPSQNDYYFGRLVSSSKPSKRSQRVNGRLITL